MSPGFGSGKRCKMPMPFNPNRQKPKPIKVRTMCGAIVFLPVAGAVLSVAIFFLSYMIRIGSGFILDTTNWGTLSGHFPGHSPVSILHCRPFLVLFLDVQPFCKDLGPLVSLLLLAAAVDTTTLKSEGTN